MAGLEKNAFAEWRGGTCFEVTGGSGHSLLVDGESERALSPMELLLASLVTCTGADVISILQKKRQAVTAMHVQVHGIRCVEHPRVYTEIEVTFHVTGRGVDPEAVRRAIELSHGKYCSVSAMLRERAQIIVHHQVHEESSAPPMSDGRLEQPLREMKND
jgi:putative redox protein